MKGKLDSEKPLFSLDRFMACDQVLDCAPNPDGKKVAVGINTSGQANIWLYGEDLPRRRVTPFTDKRGLPLAWSKDGSKLLFYSDYKGNERWQLHLYDDVVGWYEDIVVEEGVTHFSTSYCWSADGKRFVFMANRDDKSRFDLYLMNTIDRSEELIFKGLGGYQSPFWYYPRNVILRDLRIHEDSTLYNIDLKKKEAMELTPHKDETRYMPVGPWENGFFMITDEGRDFRVLSHYDLGKKSHKIVWKGAWEVESAAIGNKYLLFCTNEESFSKVHLMNMENFKVRDTEVPKGVVHFIRPVYGKDIFYLVMAKATRPTEIYKLFFQNGQEFKRITDSFYGGIPEDSLLEPESYWYKSFDDNNIHSLLYKPENVEGKTPLVVYVHGGPESQARPAYSAFVQYLIHNGIAVAQPNFRGSIGFGKNFQKLIRRDWGGGELKDVEFFVNVLSKEEWVDPKRIGIFGGSFGGFLTLSCISRLPKYWRVAGEFFGPSNLVTFAKSVPPYWKRYMKDWVGDPEEPEDLKMLEERSPIKFIGNVECPLLVVQGANDIRVVKGESDQIVEKLRNKGIKVEYLVFDDEGHGFTKESNSKQAVKKTIDFLTKHLL